MKSKVVVKKSRPKLMSGDKKEEKEVTRRVQLDLPETAMSRLSELKKRMEATSYAEVIKNALRIYTSVVEEMDAGGIVQVKQKSGKILEYRVF